MNMNEFRSKFGAGEEAMKMLVARMNACVFCVIAALNLGLAWGAFIQPAQENVPRLDVQGRISGGRVAQEHQFPYQAGLNIEKEPGVFTWCGGSLISNQWILTAAHCVDDITSIFVYLGSVNRLQPALVVRPSIKHIKLHPEFNSNTLENDIALAFLPDTLVFNEAINAISLPKVETTYDKYEYVEAIATGWGRISDTSTSISNDLRYIVRFIESNEDCQYVYGASIKSTNICMDTTGGESTCTGDSGGPLIFYDYAVDHYTLIGLTSFGKKSGCTKGYPAVFTRITSYLPWIHEITGIPSY